MLPIVPRCKRFSGYKPCRALELCPDDCEAEPLGARVLVVNLGALGAVLMTTTVLPAIKRRWPRSTVWWLTADFARPLLAHNPLIDHVLGFNLADLTTLRGLAFDVVLQTDKVRESAVIGAETRAERHLGFGMNDAGALVPLNEGSVYNWRLGVDDVEKFVHNTRTYPAMLREICELDGEVDEYVLALTDEEGASARALRAGLGYRDDEVVIGVNTGSSLLFPLKRLRPPQLAECVRALHAATGRPVVLLGGPEDTERNAELAAALGPLVRETPTREGLRRGLCAVDACDVVLTADSLGMHMAIALRKHVVAWFNVTCAPEIELYGRGEKVRSPVWCSPCWKRACAHESCLEELDVRTLVDATLRAAAARRAARSASAGADAGGEAAARLPPRGAA